MHYLLQAKTQPELSKFLYVQITYVLVERELRGLKPVIRVMSIKIFKDHCRCRLLVEDADPQPHDPTYRCVTWKHMLCMVRSCLRDSKCRLSGKEVTWTEKTPSTFFYSENGKVMQLIEHEPY